MPIIKQGYFITKQAKIRFKKWLVERDLTVNRFAKMCGCSRQYIEQILNGQRKITSSVKERFNKGNYPYL